MKYITRGIATVQWVVWPPSQQNKRGGKMNILDEKKKTTFCNQILNYWDKYKEFNK